LGNIIFNVSRLVFIATLVSSGWTMELEWVKTTAQWPVEREPLVTDINKDGKDEIIIVNRGGQVLLWDLNGQPLADGQDGQVFQLPAGRWTSRPVLFRKDPAPRIVFCSVEGMVVVVDDRFNIVFKFQLPAETVWGYALPAVFDTNSGTALCYGDKSGTVTCLSEKGGIGWQAEFAEGMCTVPLQTMKNKNSTLILAPIGTSLCALNKNGQCLWQTDLGDQISTQPGTVTFNDTAIIVCGTKSGMLVGLDVSGKIRWRLQIHDEVNTFISFYPRIDTSPLILCTGLWGSLYAFDITGDLRWTNHYRAKGRGIPLVFDADGDGEKEILVSTYAQHLYVFDKDGFLVDDVRLSGAINSSPLSFFDPASNRHDILLMTASMLAFRLRPGFPTSPYGETAVPEKIELALKEQFSAGQPASLIVHNQAAAPIVVNTEIITDRDERIITGCVSARSQIEVLLPVRSTNEVKSVKAEVRDTKQNLVEDKHWQSFPEELNPLPQYSTGIFNAWSTTACADFDPDRLVPIRRELPADNARRIVLNPVYINETEAGALVVANTSSKPNQVRCLIAEPQNRSGHPFHGKISLHEVIPVGSVNGEFVPDALPEVNSAGIVTIPANQSVKLIVNVDACGAQSGAYQAEINIIPLKSAADTVQFTIEIDVINLKIPEQFPLTLCTWDYVPNQWFPDHTESVLADMARHGVDVFPRHPIPKAGYGPSNQFEIDWTSLDAELERLTGRGIILFQLSRPPIEFTGTRTDAEKRKAEIMYIRAFCDHLRQKGWTYKDYAMYPLDEPGLHYGQNVPIFLEAARLFREADPKIQIYTDPVPALSLMDFEQIVPYLDIWCPNMRLVSGLLVHDPRMLRIMQSGHPVWSYECVSNVKTLSPLRYNRANAWRAKYFKLDGIGFWTHSQTNKDHWFAGSSINDEYALVYPGIKPVSSLRWEAVRDGLEDIAAINLLEHYITENRRLVKNEYLATEAEKYLRLALTDIMELSDAAFVEARDYLKEGDRRIWHTFTDLKLFQIHRREIARYTLLLKQE